MKDEAVCVCVSIKRLALLPSGMPALTSFHDSLSLSLSGGAHARGDAQRGGYGRQDGGERLNDKFPGFFSHSRSVVFFRVVECVFAVSGGGVSPRDAQ